MTKDQFLHNMDMDETGIAYAFVPKEARSFAEIKEREPFGFYQE